MQAGRMRHRITIQQATTSQGSNGEPIETWGTVATVWASYNPVRGREYFQAQQDQSELSVWFGIRYRSGLNAAMRVSWNSQTYQIENIVPDPTNRRELRLMCREKQDG